MIPGSPFLFPKSQLMKDSVLIAKSKCYLAMPCVCGQGKVGGYIYKVENRSIEGYYEKRASFRGSFSNNNPTIVTNYPVVYILC